MVSSLSNKLMIDEAKIDAEDDKVVEVKRASTRRRLLQIQLDTECFMTNIKYLDTNYWSGSIAIVKYFIHILY